MVFREGFKCSVMQTELYNSLESLVFRVESTEPLLCILIYRKKDFIKEFADLLSSVTVQYDRILILGDFNIQVCCPNKPMVNELNNVLESFDFIQHIHSHHSLG